MKKKILKVRQLTIGDGIPKICIPITPSDLNQLKVDLDHLTQPGICDSYDMVEWRIDYFKSAYSLKAVLDALDFIRQALPHVVLLSTYRSRREGGQASRELDDRTYEILCRGLIESQWIDFIDLEWSIQHNLLLSLINHAKKHHIYTLVSSHDFTATPPVGEIKNRLYKMQQCDADIVKIAVMPHEPKDVIMLMEASVQLDQQLLVPMVTISMGHLGMITRLFGGLMGSSITFATLLQSSAPGQLEVQQLQSILKMLHHPLLNVE